MSSWRPICWITTLVTNIMNLLYDDSSYTFMNYKRSSFTSDHRIPGSHEEGIQTVIESVQAYYTAGMSYRYNVLVSRRMRYSFGCTMVSGSGYANKLARPPETYAIGLMGGWGLASNCVYFSEPSASTRICEAEQLWAKWFGLYMKKYPQRRLCYRLGRRNLVPRRPLAKR